MNHFQCVSSSPALSSKPFRYALLDKPLEPGSATRLLRWMDEYAPWRLKEASFYTQYEFHLLQLSERNPFSELFSPAALGGLIKWVERSFNIPLSERVEVSAHKLERSHKIRIHTDFVSNDPSERESHRLLIQLNEGWSPEMGGKLVLFNSEDASDVHRVIAPRHNSGLVFELSSKSYHAVTPVQAGDRFTLVVSFYHR